MSSLQVAINQPGTWLRPQTSLMVSIARLEGSGNFFLQLLGLHWHKSGLPQKPYKIDSSLPAVYVGLWAGSGSHLIEGAGSPLVSVGLDGPGFTDSIPYSLYDFWGPDEIWAAVINNTTNLPVVASVTGCAKWITSAPTSVLQGVDTTASTGTTVITVPPDQIIV